MEIEEEKAVAEVQKKEASDSISIKDKKMPAASSSPSLCYSSEGGWRE